MFAISIWSYGKVLTTLRVCRMSKPSSLRFLNLRFVIVGGALLMVATSALAQQPVIAIWPGIAPGSEGWTQVEVEYLDGGKRKMVRNVVRPTLTAFLPE